MHIILLEDKSRTQFQLEHQIRNLGYRVEVCPEPQSVLQACRLRDACIVILNSACTAHERLAICQQLRAFPHHEHCLILLLAEAHASEQIQPIIEAGADDYLLKPFTPDRLKARLSILARRLQHTAHSIHLSRFHAVLRALGTIYQLSAHERTRERFIQHVCTCLTEVLTVQAAWIALVDEAGQLATTAEAGAGEIVFSLRKHLSHKDFIFCVQRILQQPQLVTIQDFRVLGSNASLRNIHHDAQTLAIRLEHDNTPYGILFILHSDAFVKAMLEQNTLHEIAKSIGFVLYTIGLEEQRRQHEEALKRSEYRLELALETTNDGIWEFEPRSGETYFSPRCFTMLGYVPHEFPPRFAAWVHLLHPEDRSFAEETVRQHFEAGTAFSAEFRMKAKSGDWRWMMARGKPVEWEADGTVARMVIAQTDITDRKLTNTTLERERQRLFSLLDRLPLYIYLQAPDRSIRFANRSFRKQFGDPDNGYCYKMWWGREESWEEGPVFRALTTHAPQKWEWDHYPGGKIYQVYDYPFTDIDGSSLVMECGIDMTEHKQMELALERERTSLAEKVEARTAELSEMNARLQQEIIERQHTHLELHQAKEAAESANRAKSEFLANMSHELRTPLNAILGYAQIFKQADNLSERQKEGIETIKNSGTHLLNLINEMLDLVKIEAGRMELELHSIHLPEFLHRIARMIRIRAEQKGIAFVYEEPPHLPVAVQADEKRLRQVLINLLDNAIKFTQQGTVTFHISKIEASGEVENSHSPPCFRFEVNDTGPGIPAEQLEEIFLPFQRIDATQHTAEGTGLGLAISYKLVNMMGSELCVHSAPGQGSTFGFELELPEASDFTPALPVPERRILSYTGRQRTMLIADDREKNRAVLVNMLLPLGFNIIEADNGQACLEYVRSTRLDAILLDLRMPVLDGFETARQIRKIEQARRFTQPSSEAPPSKMTIIAVSASVYEDIQRKTVEAGCDGFLRKPVELEDLLELLRVQLGLEWVYEEPAASDKIGATIPARGASSKISLSAEAVEQLRQFALRGRVKQLLRSLTELEQSEPQARPLLEELRHFTKTFQLTIVVERLQHLEDAQ